MWDFIGGWEIPRESICFGRSLATIGKPGLIYYAKFCTFSLAVNTRFKHSLSSQNPWKEKWKTSNGNSFKKRNKSTKKSVHLTQKNQITLLFSPVALPEFFPWFGKLHKCFFWHKERKAGWATGISPKKKVTIFSDSSDLRLLTVFLGNCSFSLRFELHRH